jgi:hypothetical protein
MPNSSTILRNIQAEEGWTNNTLVEILLNWIDNQPQEAQARCIRYVETRTAEPNDEEAP